VPDDLGDAATLSILTVDAQEQVRSEAWITPRNPDELHDGLLQLGFLTEDEYTHGCSSSGAAGTAESWGRWFQALAAEFRATCVSGGGRRWWVAAERLAEFLALHPDLHCHPDPARVYRAAPVERDLALVELLRSRLSGLGPVSVGVLAGDFGLAPEQLMGGLLALQAEGYAMRMAGDDSSTWCERRLLARIHRYSRDHRRRAARAVSPSAYMRFLLEWHGLGEGGGELEQALAQLEGWPAPVAAWEDGLLAARCEGYGPQRLDELFLSGYLAWFRAEPGGQAAQQLVAATPVAIVPRARLGVWRAGSSGAAGGEGSLAARIAQVLEQHGAQFTDDLASRTGLMRDQLEQGLAELVAQGRVTADAFSPLRWLIRPQAEKRKRERRLGRSRVGARGVALVGRWSLIAAGHEGPDDTAAAEPFVDQARLAALCEALLMRYGVVFRAVLERESLLPPWRLLLGYFRRMEDRGEVRGGRFVDGFSGEQFALPEAAGLLRRCAQEPRGRELRVISAIDPLNLGGILTPGVKTAARAGSRILLLNGVPVARLQGDEFEMLGPAGGVSRSEAESLLRRGRAITDPGPDAADREPVQAVASCLNT